MNSISFAGGFALALALPAFAVAAEAVVPYGDLDFSRANDVAAFNGRLEAAAATVCADIPNVQLGRRNSCKQAVRAEAVSRLPAQRRAALSAPKAAPIELARR